MKYIKTSALLIVSLFIASACQDDEVITNLPTPPPLAELLTNNFWELERWSIQFNDGQTEDITLDYCDIDTWEFFEQENLFIVYVHYRSVYHQGERCAEESYRMVQSYQRNGNELTLEGPNQGLVNDWARAGFTVSDMKITALSSEKLEITYRIQNTGPEATERERAGIVMNKTLFLSGGYIVNEPE